jgi:hypothetical protein
VQTGWNLPDQTFEALTQGLIFANGTFTAFTVSDTRHTLPNDINNHGQIVGRAASPGFSMASGFLRHPGGAVEFFEAPGAVFTDPSAITDVGQIAGWFETADETIHGFLATPIPTSAATRLRVDTAAAAGIPDPAKRLLLEILDGVLLQMALGEAYVGSETLGSQTIAQVKFGQARDRLQRYADLLGELLRNGEVAPPTAMPLLAAGDALRTQLNNVIAGLCRECSPLLASTSPSSNIAADHTRF